MEMEMGEHVVGLPDVKSDCSWRLVHGVWHTNTKCFESEKI